MGGAEPVVCRDIATNPPDGLTLTIKEWQAFDADTGKDTAREIREYFIPDLSNWKDHDNYQQAFQRLLRDLKTK